MTSFTWYSTESTCTQHIWRRIEHKSVLYTEELSKLTRLKAKFQTIRACKYASLNPCSDQPTNVESLPTKRIDRILHENNQTPNFAATRNQQQRMQWNRMPENPLSIHTAQASSYEDTEGQDPGYTCVLERHFHCPTRGPLSKSISNPILLADIPNMYLPDIPDIT